MLHGDRWMYPAPIVGNQEHPDPLFLASEWSHMELPLTATLFTAAEMSCNKEIMHLHKETSQETPSIKPEKLDPMKWPNWSKQFITYLSNLQGAQHSPLDYVVREEPPSIPVNTMIPH